MKSMSDCFPQLFKNRFRKYGFGALPEKYAITNAVVFMLLMFEFIKIN